MEKREQLYEGKAKKVFATDDPDLVIVSYKDDATAFDGLYYGCADSYVGLAFTTVDTLVDYIKENDDAGWNDHDLGRR